MPRLLTLDDIDAYLAYFLAQHAESGRDGDPYSGPYSRHAEFPVEEFRARTRRRWEKTLDTPAWRRAWACLDEDCIIGSANVHAGEIEADLHRVTLGIGVLRSHRRQGHGRRLLETVIAWCAAQPEIEWITDRTFDSEGRLL